MSLRSQAYEWRNITTGTSVVSNIGHPILTYDSLGVVQATARQVLANIPTDIMIGGIGNNLEMPASNRAHKFVVIDNIGSFPNTAALNIRIETTRYFKSPDGVPSEGMPALAMPFQPSTITGNQEIIPFYAKLMPTIYILPGQTWGIEYTTTAVLNAGGTIPLTDNSIARAFVAYLLVDGPDQLIAMRLLSEEIPVNPENIQWYKQQLIRNRLRADLGMEKTLEETFGSKDRRFI